MQLIYGINPLLEIFHSDPSALEKIFIAEGRGRDAVRKIVELASENSIPLELIGREKIEKMAPRRVHQGVVALCREHVYASVDEVVANRYNGSTGNLIIILDSVTDPHNLGSIIRTASCCGANGVIIPENRAAAVTASVAKASAGAVHGLPIAMVVNLARVIDDLKGKGFWIYGADAASTVNFHAPEYEGHVGLVMGSEGRGLRPLIREKCDFLISIPVWGQVASLNVSVAAGIILYEILRRREKGS
jgi:23S rRNA (guanosine2251-2'-O)-methyltransferase